MCTDELGDLTVLIASQFDEARSAAADILETRVTLTENILSVRWALAPGASSVVASGANQVLRVSFEPVDGSYPWVEVSASRSSDFVGSQVSTTTQESGLTWVDDAADVEVVVEGDDVVLSLPVGYLLGMGGSSWHWYSESVGAGAQDACGSTDAGAGSRYVFFEGVELPPFEPVALSSVKMCDRVPTVEDLEAVMGIELEGPSGRYDSECSFHGVEDPTDYVLFSSFQKGLYCDPKLQFVEPDRIGDLDGVPFQMTGGISGETVLCLDDQDLQVGVSVEPINDDDGPLSLELARLWVPVLAASTG